MIAVGCDVPALARIVRARTLIVRQELYVDASRCFGAAGLAYPVEACLPNSLPPVIVQVTLLQAAHSCGIKSLFPASASSRPTQAGRDAGPCYQYMESRRSRCIARIGNSGRSLGIQCARRSRFRIVFDPT